MSIAPGTRFGPYEITDAIGAGGMGEVYRATDTNLKRDVAIKILPPAFVGDADRIARFQREAEALAALNHPNIAHIYGLERSGENTVLAMELVEGPTLADRIAEGPIPTREALDIALQIADALEAAHDRGIVHRDLKPANIKLRPDGTVKVLDFGIAKAPESPLSASGGRSPTLLTPALTEVGVLLGTAAYMSPEQAKGRAVDQRADIWALGCVLYEMLTGQPAFGGEDVTTTLARVLERDPNLDSLPEGVSPAVKRALELCLQKDVKKRIRHIGDVKLALEGAFETSSSLSAHQAPGQRRVWHLPAAALSVLIAVAVTGVVAWRLKPVPVPPVRRFTIALPDTPTGDRPELALSDDGRYLSADVGSGSAPVGLWVRPMDIADGRLIAKLDYYVLGGFWQPSGREVAFFGNASRRLLALSPEGGSPRLIADVPAPQRAIAWADGSWSTRGEIVFTGGDGAIYSVPATGGDPIAVTSPVEGERHRFPEFLPDSESFLYVVAPGNAVHVHKADGDDVELALSGLESAVRYSPAGYLVFARRGSLWAQRFDARALELKGEPQEIATGEIDGEFDVSNDDLVYQSRAPLKRLTWVDRHGTPLGEVGEPDRYIQIALSPDARRVVTETSTGIFVRNLDTGIRSVLSLTTPDAVASNPNWISDDAIAFSSMGAGALANLYRQNLGSDSSSPLLPASDTNRWTEGFSQGRLIWLETDRGDGSSAAMALDLNASHAKPKLLLQVPYGLDEPNISPDGKWLSYTANQSGEFEVYLRPLKDDGTAGDAALISRGGGGQPRWTSDSHELIYLGQDGVLYSVSIGGQTGPPGEPQRLFQTGIKASAITDQFSMTPDGQRFLLIRSVQDAAVTVVLNWAAELEDR